MSPTSRTLAYLRELGYTCQVVERWCSYSRRRIDLFGWIDIIAIAPDGQIVGVQASTLGNIPKRIKKADELGEPFKRWLLRNEAWFVGWRKLKVKRGGKAVRWTVDVRKVKATAPTTVDEPEVAK